MSRPRVSACGEYQECEVGALTTSTKDDYNASPVSRGSLEGASDIEVMLEISDDPAKKLEGRGIVAKYASESRLVEDRARLGSSVGCWKSCDR